MSANISSIESHTRFKSAPAWRGRKRVFDLGEHFYSATPGCDWRTNYWIKKIEKGKRCELYASDEDSLRTRQYCGTFTPKALRDELALAGFGLEEEEWQSMGLGIKSEVINIKDAKE
jgi:hypothetical protein